MYALYVGADNETGVLDIERVATLVSKQHESFTLTRGIGYWRGRREDMVIVMIDDHARETAQLLKAELNQEAVGIQSMPPIEMV